MVSVSIKDARNRLSELARRVESGETVLVTRNGKPVMELVPPRKSGGIDWEAGQKFLRDRGIDRVVSYISDDFDDPLPEDFLLRPLPE